MSTGNLTMMNLPSEDLSPPEDNGQANLQCLNPSFSLARHVIGLKYYR